MHSSNTDSPQSRLALSVHARNLHAVSLEDVTRELLVDQIMEDSTVGYPQGTTFAHQFGRARQLHRIQHLLQPEDYDLTIPYCEPPLYCLVLTLESIKLFPQDLFTENRLFSYHEADADHVWMLNIVLNRLVHHVPKTCISKERLLKPYHPNFPEETLINNLIATGQIEGIYPELVSSRDIIECDYFPNTVKSICWCEHPIRLEPSEFISCYPELKENWIPTMESKDAKQWLKEVSKSLLRNTKSEGSKG